VTSGPSLYRPFTEIGCEESEIQFHPKARGAYALEAALVGEHPDFCLLFSSNAAVLGGLGYVTYAAANAFLNAFAASRSRRTGFPWLSANWDAWPEETRKYAGVQTSMDQYTMTCGEAVEAFRRVVCLAPGGAVAVPTGDLSVRLALWVYRTAPDRGCSVQHPRPNLKSGYLEPSTETERTIAGIWQDVLGLEQVGVQDNFFDLGGHSLLATRLVARLNEVFRLDFPLGRFFEAPTVAGCAGIVDELRASAGGVDEKLAILQLLEELSEEEVTTELGRLGLEELRP
jgi:phthiocerol/phenolphthiocerol synthesis type-I polyketide synthase E